LLAIALGQAPPGPAIAITQQRLTPLAQPSRTEETLQSSETPVPGAIQLTNTSAALAIGQPTQPANAGLIAHLVTYPSNTLAIASPLQLKH
jgi:hypothetical protein